MSGWIKLDRSITDHWIMQDPVKFHAWATMLLSVNFKDSKLEVEGQIIHCPRGSSIYSASTWAGKFGKGWTSRKVRTFFKLLESDSMIIYEGLRKTSRVTICNYDTYQSTGNTEVTQESHRSNTEVTEMSQRCKQDKKDKKEEKEIKYKEETKIVMNHLNQNSGRRFKDSKGLKARFNEGYTVEDALKVIDTKIAEWGNNPDMSQYIRPETLFGKKFDSYLNQDIMIAQPKQTPTKMAELSGLTRR